METRCMLVLLMSHSTAAVPHLVSNEAVTTTFGKDLLNLKIMQFSIMYKQKKMFNTTPSTTGFCCLHCLQDSATLANVPTKNVEAACYCHTMDAPLIFEISAGT